MGLPAYLVTNLISGNSTITSDTEDANYPHENLYDQILANPFRFTVTTGGYIEVDLGSAQSFDTIFLGGHNLDASATIVITAGNSPAPTTGIAAPAYRAGGMVAVITPTQSARYIRITITDSNTDNTEIGELVIGARVALPRSFRHGFGGGVLQQNLQMETERGVKWVYKQYQREQREYEFRIDGDAELSDFRTLHNAVDGNLTPFVWIPDISGTDVYYVRKERGFAFTELREKDAAYDYRMSLSEETPGTSVTT
jgi:hypothetical protein